MIIEVKSVASVYDTETKMFYAKYQMGGYDKLSGIHIDDLSKTFVDSISEEDMIRINESVPPIHGSYEDLYKRVGVKEKY